MLLIVGSASEETENNITAFLWISNKDIVVNEKNKTK